MSSAATLCVNKNSTSDGKSNITKSKLKTKEKENTGYGIVCRGQSEAPEA